MCSISTSGNILLLCFFANNNQSSTLIRSIFYWGGFFLNASWGVHSSEGHPPLKTIFAIEIDARLMKQL